ncbi:hypothetical protein LXL04_033701 [Taraxacum kok-saghyz]
MFILSEKKIEKGIIQLVKIDTKENVSDILTKALSSCYHEYFSGKLSKNGPTFDGIVQTTCMKIAWGKHVKMENPTDIWKLKRFLMSYLDVEEQVYTEIGRSTEPIGCASVELGVCDNEGGKKVILSFTLVSFTGQNDLASNNSGWVQLNLMAPSRDSYYGNQQAIQGLGQLNSIAPNHECYYGAQPTLHGMGQMDFLRAPGFTYDIRVRVFFNDEGLNEVQTVTFEFTVMTCGSAHSETS